MLSSQQHLPVIAALGKLPHPLYEGETQSRLYSERSVWSKEGFHSGANRPGLCQRQHMAWADVAAVAVRARAADRALIDHGHSQTGRTQVMSARNADDA